MLIVIVKLEVKKTRGENKLWQNFQKNYNAFNRKRKTNYGRTFRKNYNAFNRKRKTIFRKSFKKCYENNVYIKIN